MIPKELQSAYQRWEMTSFNEAPLRPQAHHAASMPEPEAGPEVRQVALPTAEELEALHEQARAEGYAQGLEEGRAAGHAEGHAEGAAAGRQQAEAEQEQLRALAAAFGAALAQAGDDIAQDLLELALRLARGMVRTAFAVRPGLILPVVREALGQLPALAQPAVLTLHPEDAVIVRQAMGQELSEDGWRIVEDAALARGGCMLETAANQIDAQAQARWRRLTHALGQNVDWLGD